MTCLFNSRTSTPLLPAAVALLAVFALTGCDRDEIKVYRVAKEPPAAAPSPAGLPEGHPEIPRGKPQLSWTLPAGWTEAAAGQMSLATFNIAGQDGQQAQVAVTPLRGLSGKEALIVNMWRKSAGQAELSPEEVTSQLQAVDIGGEVGKMFDVTSATDSAKRPTRIVTAMVHRPDASWFFKLAGDQELVEAQKPAFVTFLKSVKITEAPATETTTTEAPVAAKTSKTQWKTPTDWKSVAPGVMQVAKFTVPEKDSTAAEVTVSIFSTDTGGTLENVTRWRNQIGLPPATESDLPQLVKPLDGKNPDALLVDMTNGNRRVVGAIVTRDGQWFFFKLLGGTAAVAAQQEAFVAFVKSPM